MCLVCWRYDEDQLPSMAADQKAAGRQGHPSPGSCNCARGPTFTTLPGWYRVLVMFPGSGRWYHSSRVRRGALSTLLADRHLVLYQLGHSPTQNIKLFPQIVQPSVFRLELKQIYSIREINTVTGHDWNEITLTALCSMISFLDFLTLLLDASKSNLLFSRTWSNDKIAKLLHYLYK